MIGILLELSRPGRAKGNRYLIRRLTSNDKLHLFKFAVCISKDFTEKFKTVISSHVLSASYVLEQTAIIKWLHIKTL